MRKLIIILLITIPHLVVGQKKAILSTSYKHSGITNHAHAGHTYLVANALGYWNVDYSISATSEDNSLQTQIPDLSPNNYDFLNNGGLSLPKLKPVNSFWTRKLAVMGPTGSSNVDANYHRITGAQATDLFNQDFELFLAFELEDADFGVNSMYILASRDIPSAVQGQIMVYINAGRIYFEYRSGGSLVQYYTTNPYFQNLSIGRNVVAIRFDATTDVFQMRVNGVQPTLTTGGSITSASPASFNLGSRRLLLHGYDNNGTINGISDGGSIQILMIAVTGLLTDTQRVPILDLFSEGLEKDIVVIGDPTSNVLVEGGSAYNFGVCLKAQPGSTVTVTPTVSGVISVSGALTFTTSDWNVPQYVTLTPPASDGTTQWFRAIDVTLTATGGLSYATSYRAMLTDETTHYATYVPKVNNAGVMGSLKIENSVYTYEQQQAYLIQTIFNGAGLPSGAPESIDTYTTTQSVTCHSFNNTSLTAGYKASFRRLNFDQVDGDGYTWTNRAFFWEAASPVNKLMINMEGTGGEGHAAWIDNMLSKGFDVLHHAMPTSGVSPGGGLNIENSPAVAQGSFTSMVSNGVDQSDFFAYRLFLFDRIRALDYLINTLGKTYSEIYVSGISGGNQPALYLASVDSRINGYIGVRTYPWDAEIYSNSTQLQILQKRCPLLDRLSIFLSRPNSRFFVYSNIADASNNASRWPILVDYLNDLYGSKISITFESEASRSTHQYGAYEIALINTLLGI